MENSTIRAFLKLLKDHPAGLEKKEIKEKTNLTSRELEKCAGILKAGGYTLIRRENTYKLEITPDPLLPWEFPGYENLIRFKPRVGSTMAWAREEAATGAQDGTILIAATQSGGKGRLERTWNSGEGGLYFTLILRPQVHPGQAYLFNFAAAIALVRTFREQYNLPAFIKWPNDVLIDEKKISGILLEMQASADHIRNLNIGIGINVNNILDPSLPQATSLKELKGKSFSRRGLLLDFLSGFLALRKEIKEGGQLTTHFKNLSSTLGREVCVNLKDGGTLRGLAVEFTQDGALEVRDEHGKIHKVYYGDCAHL